MIIWYFVISILLIFNILLCLFDCTKSRFWLIKAYNFDKINSNHFRLVLYFCVFQFYFFEISFFSSTQSFWFIFFVNNLHSIFTLFLIIPYKIYFFSLLSTSFDAIYALTERIFIRSFCKAQTTRYTVCLFALIWINWSQPNIY